MKYIVQNVFVKIYVNRQVLWAIGRVEEKFNADTKFLSSTVSTSAAVSFVILACSLLKQKQFATVWPLVSLCDEFFDVLSKGGESSSLFNVIKKLHADQAPATKVIKIGCYLLILYLGYCFETRE